MDELKRQAEVILATAKAIVDYPGASVGLIADGAQKYGPDAEVNGFEAAVQWQVELLRKGAKRAHRKAEKAAQAAA